MSKAKKHKTHSGALQRAHHMHNSSFNSMHSHLIQHLHAGRHGGFVHKKVKKF